MNYFRIGLVVMVACTCKKTHEFYMCKNTCGSLTLHIGNMVFEQFPCEIYAITSGKHGKFIYLSIYFRTNQSPNLFHKTNSINLVEN